MIVRRLLPILGWLLLTLPVQGQSTPQPQPSIAFEENALTATGFTAGGKAAWFGFEVRGDAEFSFEWLPHYLLEDVPPDGMARLDLERRVARTSLWVAVDLTSGTYAVAAPEGYRVAKSRLPARPSLGEGAVSDGILDRHPYTFGLMVRPGQGAWQFAGADGSTFDSDGAVNGEIRFALDGLLALPGAAEGLTPPVKATSQDLWFVVDPRRMALSILKGGVSQ